jgi:hypothetical protein
MAATSLLSHRACANILALAAFTAIWCFFALKVPFNMDEAIHYQPVACLQFPYARWHEFREACGEKELFLFTWLPLRSFHYAGALSNIAFYPFWLVWNGPLVLRFFGFILGIGSLVIFSRLVRVSLWLGVLTLGLFPPFLFQHVVDTGPIAWQLFWGLAGSAAFAKGFEAVVALRVANVLRWKDVLGPFGLALFAGVSFFLVLEQKLFGVFFFPFFASTLALRWRDEVAKSFLFGLKGLRQFEFSWKVFNFSAAFKKSEWMLNMCSFVAVTAAVTAGLLNGLMSLETRLGSTYGSVLHSNASRLTTDEVELHAEKLFHFLANYVFQPEQYLHRIYGFSAGDWYVRVGTLQEQWMKVSEQPNAIWPLLGVLLLPLCCLVVRRSAFLWCSGLLCAGFAILVAIVNVRYSWAGHHVIAAHLFVALAALAALVHLKSFRAGIVVCMLSAVSAFSYWQAARLDESRVLAHSSRSREELFRFVDNPEFARSHFLVHLNWGTYYIDALFGPRDQLVTYIEPFHEAEHFARISGTAKTLGRKVAFLGRSNDQPSWQAFLRKKGMSTLAVSSDGLWTLWGEALVPGFQLHP